MKYLYGKPGAEEMSLDEEDVAARWYDDGADLESNIIEEWSTEGGFEQFIMSASSTAEWVSDHASDEVLFEEAAEALSNAARDPEVIAAFEVAREALINKAGKRWLFAGKLNRTGLMKLHEDDMVVIEWRPER